MNPHPSTNISRWTRIDALSQATLARFGLMLAAVVTFAIASGDFRSTWIALWAVAALTAAVLARMLHERFFEIHLNRWDETAAYVGLYLLGHLARGEAS